MKLIFAFFLLLTQTTLAASRLEIIKIGHPTLRAQASDVDLSSLQDPKFQQLIDDMIYTMDVAGGIGLAAPQVNQSIRMFVMKSWPGVPLTVIINPKIEYLEAEGKRDSTEGCLSIPGKKVKLKRFKKIHISYFDRKGQYVSKELRDLAAVIAQHEYDHLNGVLIVDLIEQLNEIMNYSGYTDAPLM